MQALANALLGELASRTISFLVSTYGSTAAAAPEQEEEDLRHRLRLLLLRCGTIVEEAEGRRVTSRGMLQQLGALRDEMLRGYYVLDTISRGGGAPSAEDGRHRRRAFAPSRFNPAKRVRFRRFASGGDPEATAAVVHRRRVISLSELQRTVRCLEAAATDTKELVVFLVRCPRLHRQPYSAHLFLDKYMFGRNAERDHVVGFLLRTDPPGAANPGVLPIVGPRFIGKSTLVEHVCGDERVRDHFSSILLYRADDLEARFSLPETLSSFRKNCVTKQHRKSGASDGRSLIVIELAGDVDDNTWKRLYSSAGRRLPQGSKILLTSRSERRSREAFWYFFKLLVFGSADPGEHPGLASMAMAMALEARGSFMIAYVMAAMLRADFSRQLWGKVLGMARRHVQENAAVFDEYPDDFKARPWQVGSMVGKPEPDGVFLVYDSYQKDAAQQEALPDPEITLVDLLSGRAHQRGRFEVLHWKSVISPYFSYVGPCEIRDT
ncbi:hypothetical protein PVAP13_6NG164600 [Panicum virgatum]|uniref:NB-ARC domain-containing protein n=1 Tax=Panicum virgatum TaxID=38727 RepID=A0A8T0QZL1_PANVG|nr:hypothetical protein PVAP13_6NG164600 [Panicum virgatum]